MKRRIFSVFVAVLSAVTVVAQTVNVPFAVNGEGKKLPIEWGMDAAWDWDYNVMRGIAHYGKNFTTGRISFQPYNLVDASKIDDASANYGLSAGQVRKLQWRIDLIKRTGATKVNINCDHEVLTKKMDDQGNYGEELDNVGKGNYVSTSRNSYKTTEWVNLIKATVKYAQAQGLEVISVSPFNESDYGWNQYYNAVEGASEANQNTYGIPTFKAIAKAIKDDSFFEGIRVCGGNTLNCDRATAWFDGLKDYLDEGNTHQLAGSFDNYANFFKHVRDENKVATADEVHNVGEAMVGVEYGMQNGIWWGFDSKARGQFMHDSNEGVRLGYAEDRPHWTSAAVYRNDKDKEIHAFIGSSERQANPSTYKFQCTDRDVYFNGYGPQREWSVTTVGGASGSYQNGQINYERLIDITYGEDVQSFPVDGNYQLMNAYDMKLVTSNGYWADNNHLSAAAQSNSDSQRWHIYPGQSTGDCSYWFIDNVGDDTQHWNLLNGGGAGALEAGARIICYNAGHDALEQWYLRYAKDGYFFIMTRQSNQYLYNNNGTLSLQDAPTGKTGAQELKKYLWRLMPTDAVAEQTAPAVPDGVTASAVGTASVELSWTAVTGEAKAVTYNVLRQDADGWNTIARLVEGTGFTDTKVEAGKAYNYMVQAVDYSGNRSQTSVVVTAVMPESTEVPEFNAGQWEWVGETSATGDYYLMNKSTKTFIKDNNTLNVEGTLWNLTNTGSGDNVQWTIKCKDGTPHYLYVNRTGKSANSLSAGNFTAYSNGQNLTTSATLSTVFWIKGDNSGYTFNTYVQYRDRSGWTSAASGDVYVGANNTNLATGIQSNSSADTYKWLFISADQYTKYALFSDYTAAFNTAKGYLTKELSSSLRDQLISTLDDCKGTVNYNNIESFISQLNGISEACENYTPAPVTENDFTGLIVNPIIIQNGTTNDAPTGWKGAATNVTGNGHWTEGTGDTRLEAWHWTADLNVEYYQDVIVPNGLYTLTAVTHQRENGNAVLYGESYKSFETKMPVGDGNEAQTDVTEILVTDGSLRIGMKVSGSGNWATADDFRLVRLSTPAETELSHYTDAIAYLHTLADKELVRPVDHRELLAARDAANNCEAEADAYSRAINNYLAAISRSQTLEETEPVLSTSWVGQTGTSASGSPERYNWDTPYPEGRILYQVIEDLVPGHAYEIQFYAVANVARNLDAGLYSGNGIAYLFANDTEQDIEVLYQDGCDHTNYLRTLTAVADENGQITYGIANRKTGGQWYLAQSKSVTRLGRAIVLDEAATALPTLNEHAFSVTAKRTMKTTYWNPVCFPFDIDEATIEDKFEYVRELTGISVNGKSVLLNFTAPEGKMEAGKPYIVIPKEDMTELVMNDIDVNTKTTDVVCQEGNATISMAGVLTTTKLTNGEYYLTTSNQFKYLNEGKTLTLKGMRAYFVVTTTNGARLQLELGDENETAVDVVDAEKELPDGKYLENGRLVIVKNGVKYYLNGLKK